MKKTTKKLIIGMMTRIALILTILLSVIALISGLPTVYNPYTGKLDYYGLANGTYIDGRGIDLHVAVFNGTSSITSILNNIYWDSFNQRFIVTDIQVNNIYGVTGVDGSYLIQVDGSAATVLDMLIKSTAANANIRLIPQSTNKGYGRVETESAIKINPKQEVYGNVLGGVTDACNSELIYMYNDGDEEPDAYRDLLPGDFVYFNLDYSKNATVIKTYNQTLFEVDRPSGDCTTGQTLSKRSGLLTLYDDNDVNIGYIDYKGDFYLNRSIIAKSYSGTLSWSNLTNFPVACPAGTYVTQLGSSITCTAVSGGFNTNQNNELNTSGSPSFYSINNITSLYGTNLTLQVSTNVFNGTAFTNNKGSSYINLSTQLLLYHFDNNSIDYATGKYNGTSLTGITNNTGVLNNSYNFSGTPSLTASASSCIIKGLANISISTWIYPTTSGASYTGTVYSENEGAGVVFLLRQEDNILDFGVLSGTGSWAFAYSNALTLNSWQYVTATFDGLYTRIYIDSVQQGNASFNGGLRAGACTNGVYLGKRSGNAEYFQGRIDEFSLFNKTLNQSEITTIYNNQKFYVNTSNTLTSLLGFNIQNQIINVSGSNFTGGYWDGLAKNSTYSVNASYASNAGSATSAGTCSIATEATTATSLNDGTITLEDDANNNWNNPYGGFASQNNIGITDTTSYWLCTASDCSSSCQIQIYGGLITGCV